MKTWKTLMGAAICLAVAGIAFAAVTFDPATGTGFVGKGDVQTALGLNNAQMQAQAESLEFTYVTVDTYQVVNAWATGNPDNPVSLNSHTATVTTTVSVNSTVAYDPRQVKGQKQFTGFNLTGFGDDYAVVGEIPEVSPTVTYVTFTWDEQVWTGEWTTDPVTGKKVKVYETVTHETDQLPVDENGNLYMEGNNKAVLSVTLLDSVGGLFVNDVALPIMP
jgi:hypothetical protein